MVDRPTIDMTDSPTGSASTPVQKAVAIQHEKGDVPLVVASGKGNVAEQILKIAFERGI
jgi:type III secretion system FlhB-like substrate exporter